MISKTFAYHKPSNDGLAKIASLRESFSDLMEHIKAVCPDSREKSVAITNLEQAGMWAIKAVVSNDPASIVDL